MAPPSAAVTAPPPSRTLVATATLATQLLGTLAFVLALAWVVALRVTDPVVVAIAAAGAACVFAGGNAHRGNLAALGMCALFDIGIAVATLGRLSATEAFAVPAFAHVDAEQHVRLALFVAGTIAALAAITCIAALPQARRFAAWRGEQILHAARVVRG